jgi:glycosyltransferase involved in cell wall biosynthesis
MDLPARDSARDALGLPRDGFVVGFVGRLDPCKDLPHLVKACAARGVLGPADRLLLVGEGEDKARVQACVAELGMADRCVFAGRKAGAELNQAYAAMDTFVLPSLYEGYGMVVLEAMAAGVPVIGRPGNGTSTFTSMAEMIEPGITGLLMHHGDVNDLSDKLRWLKERPQRAMQIGRQARERLATRPWSAVIRDYLQTLGLIEDVAGTVKPASQCLAPALAA